MILVFKNQYVDTVGVNLINVTLTPLTRNPISEWDGVIVQISYPFPIKIKSYTAKNYPCQ